MQRRWCWRLQVSSLTACTRSRIEQRQTRRSARFFDSTFVVAFQTANTAGGKRRARNRQRHRGSNQNRHNSEQSEYIALHEPVPRLALIESVYHSNRRWRAQKTGGRTSSSIVGSFGSQATNPAYVACRCVMRPAPGWGLSRRLGAPAGQIRNYRTVINGRVLPSCSAVNGRTTMGGAPHCRSLMAPVFCVGAILF